MVKRSPTLGTLVSTKTKCIMLIFIGKITRVPVAFLMALSIFWYFKNSGEILNNIKSTDFLASILSNYDFSTLLLHCLIILSKKD